MKLLLYCTKSKPYLFDFILDQYPNRYGLYDTKKDCDSEEEALNGKIVAECDYEVEWYDTYYSCMNFKENNGLVKSCLTDEELFDYLKGKSEFYSIHIKNLHIFDEPKELSDYYKTSKINTFDDYDLVNESIDKAPQNMMYCYDDKDDKKVLISIRPEWLCKILNGEKTIEIRKKVPKEMLNEK